MAANMFKLLSRRFRRDPLFFVLISLLVCVITLLYLLPNPKPYINLAFDLDNQSIVSNEWVTDRSVEYNNININITSPVYRDNVRGNFEPTRKLIPLFNRPGDYGKAHSVDGIVSPKRVQNLKSEYGLNVAVSEHIPMDRILPDIRPAECKYWHYPEELPFASVVIVFHNEPFSTLMRTVHSVLLRSPQRFLREVLLVDDYSDKQPLKSNLEKYIVEHFGSFKIQFERNEQSRESLQGERLDEKSGKVRLLRNKERAGLIRTRVRGAREALGEVVVFLDAHCEVNTNWLVPLLAPIAANNRTLTVPTIEGIDSNNFHYRSVYNSKKLFTGIWEWGMLYKEIEIDLSKHLKEHRFSEPYESPTHAGGLFAIGKQFFFELGAYDEGLLVWGGENFELSFKTWQCGGRLLWVPCSRVGHVYRAFMPYRFGSLANQRKGPLILTNYKRVIEVWFDEQYKQYFYTRQPLATFYESGNISGQLALKSTLQCKSFDWFVTNHAQSVFKKFPRLPPNVAWGELRNVKFAQFCLNSVGPHPPSVLLLSMCTAARNKLFRLNEKGQIGFGERCIDGNTSSIKVHYCKLGTVDGPWSYCNDTKQMRYRERLCLTAKNSSRVLLDSCDDQSSGNQQWTWQTIKPAGS